MITGQRAASCIDGHMETLVVASIGLDDRDGVYYGMSWLLVGFVGADLAVAVR